MTLSTSPNLLVFNNYNNFLHSNYHYLMYHSFVCLPLKCQLHEGRGSVFWVFFFFLVITISLGHFLTHSKYSLSLSSYIFICYRSQFELKIKQERHYNKNMSNGNIVVKLWAWMLIEIEEWSV